MSHDGAYAGAPFSSYLRQARPEPHLAAKPEIDHRRTRARPCECLFKASTRRTQGAFARIDERPCGLPELVRDNCSSSLPSPAPLSGHASLLPLSLESRRASLPCALLARLAAHLECARKMLRPELCNRPPIRAPENRSTPEPAARAAVTASTRHTKAFTLMVSRARRRTTLRQSDPR